jgi:hypothetical protein
LLSHCVHVHRCETEKKLPSLHHRRERQLKLTLSQSHREHRIVKSFLILSLNVSLSPSLTFSMLHKKLCVCHQFFPDFNRSRR